MNDDSLPCWVSIDETDETVTVRIDAPFNERTIEFDREDAPIGETVGDLATITYTHPGRLTAHYWFYGLERLGATVATWDLRESRLSSKIVDDLESVSGTVLWRRARDDARPPPE